MDRRVLEGNEGIPMDTQPEGLSVRTVADADQNLTDDERQRLYSAFQLIERQLGGRIELIVARNESEGFAFMEPNHGTPDMGRVMRKLARLVLFVSGEA
jgi:hypothetical protein